MFLSFEAFCKYGSGLVKKQAVQDLSPVPGLSCGSVIQVSHQKTLVLRVVADLGFQGGWHLGLALHRNASWQLEG